jgi:N-acetylglucosaminyl-diphospho-decaprenol L-rhamnosyltransferase
VPDSPTLAIVIVSFNVREHLDACLRAIPAAAGNVTRMTVVVDNGSSDGTLEMLRERWPETQVIATGANLGFARANNVGIRSSRSELVLLLNPDTVPSPGSLARLVQTLHAHPEAAAIGPRLVDAAGVPELSFGWPLTPIGEFRQKTLQRALDRGRPRPVHRWLTRALSTPGTHDWVSGACLLARRDDLEAVGLLDERYFMYAEDIDLCKALRRRGRTVRFEPAAEVQHLRGRSADANPQLERMRRQSQMAYYRKHHPFWAPVLGWYLRLVRRASPADVGRG